MKRMLAILLAAVLLFGTAACMPTPNNQTTNPGGTLDTQPPKMVTVTLDPNDGSNPLVITLPENVSYGQLPQAQRQDYIFLGWYTDPEAGTLVQPDMALISRENHTLYAHWQPQTEYTLTLDPNEGRLETEANTMTVVKDQPYGELPTPIREGYRFLGWYTAAEEGLPVDAETVFTGGDHTLYAHWEYDAVLHWTYILHQRVSTIPESRRVVVYLEQAANYKTYPESAFLDDAGAINPAAGLTNESVTDGWIQAAEPYIIVKLTSNIYMGAVNKVAMQRRFPELQIYIFSVDAVSGSQASQVYYRFQLAKILYPEYFEDVDLTAIATEFGITPRIY